MMSLALLLLSLAQASAPAPLPTDDAVIVIYRGSSIVGSAVGCPVRFHEREIVELGRGKYAEWHVAPGRYILTNKTSSVEVTAVAGEKSYVRCAIKAGMLTGRADLQIVDAESFAEHAADFTRKDVELAQ